MSRRVLKATGVICLIFLLPMIYSAEECDEPNSLDNVPCVFFLPVNESDNCVDYSVNFYSNETLLGNQTLQSSTNPSLCRGLFNYSTVGTYTLYYSSGDNGTVVITEGSKMIEIFYFMLVIAIALMILGLYLQNQPLIAIDGILWLTLGFWIFKNGYSIYQNVITDAIGLVAISVGGYFLVLATLAMIDEGYLGGYEFSSDDD